MSDDVSRFVTKADLAELETRLVRDINSRDWRMVGAVFIIVGLAVAILKFA